MERAATPATVERQPSKAQAVQRQTMVYVPYSPQMGLNTDERQNVSPGLPHFGSVVRRGRETPRIFGGSFGELEQSISNLAIEKEDVTAAPNIVADGDLTESALLTSNGKLAKQEELGDEQYRDHKGTLMGLPGDATAPQQQKQPVEDPSSDIAEIKAAPESSD